MRPKARDLLCILATLSILSIGAANRLRIGSPPDAKPHLEQVKAAAMSVLHRPVPGMVVASTALPRQAFDMLNPNVLDSRTFDDLTTGRSFSVLLVHCGDVNDMGAHYPPECYPGSGLRVTNVEPMPLELAGRTLQGVEYTLEPSRLDQRSPIRIWNCMFLPGGTTTHEPLALRLRTRSGSARYYGAGQIQVLVSAALTHEQRIANYREALAIFEPAIEAMLTDPQKAPQAQTDAANP